MGKNRQRSSMITQTPKSLGNLWEMLCSLSHRPGSETDAPRVATSPCVRVVPRAHGVVTGAAAGRCRSARP